MKKIIMHNLASFGNFAHVLLVFVVCYATSAFSQFGLITDFTNYPPFTMPTIQNALDSDADGLPDCIELSGMLPVLFPLPLAGMDVPSINVRQEAQPLSFSSEAGQADVFEWVFGDGFTYTIGNQTYDRAWVSASGILSFGSPLNPETLLVYPLEKTPENQLMQIPQISFLQTNQTLVPPWQNNYCAYTASFTSDSRDFFLLDVYANCTISSHYPRIRIQILSDQRIRISYNSDDLYGCLSECDMTQTHTIGYQFGEGGVMISNVTLNTGIEIRPFEPTDPFSSDTDGNGYSDGSELLYYGCDPTSLWADLNYDGVPDIFDVPREPLSPYLPFSNVNEFLSLFSTDSDDDGWPDYWEFAFGSNPNAPFNHPDSTEWALVQIYVPCNRNPFDIIKCDELFTPITPTTEGCVVPVPWGKPIDLPAGSYVGECPGGMILCDFSAPEDVFRFQAVRVFLEPAGGEKIPGAQGNVCIHPPYPRTATLRLGTWDGSFSLELGDTYWVWSAQNGEGREFTTDSTSATLKIKADDKSPLGSLEGYLSIMLTPFDSPWQVHTCQPSCSYSISRCALEKEDEETGTDGKTKYSCAFHLFENHCCIHSKLCPPYDGMDSGYSYGSPSPGLGDEPGGDTGHCCTSCENPTSCSEDEYDGCIFHILHNATGHCCLHSENCIQRNASGDPLPSRACPYDTCTGDDGACSDPYRDFPPEERKEQHEALATLHLATLRLDNNDSDANGTRDFEQSHSEPDPDWKKPYFRIAPFIPGPCCECPEHGSGQGDATYTANGIQLYSQSGAPLSGSIKTEDRPVYAQGLEPSTSFFDKSVVVHSGTHINTNRYTIGALTLEPANRNTLVSHPTTNVCVISCGEFFPVIVKTEVFLPGTFILSLHTSGLFEIWFPPATLSDDGKILNYEMFAEQFRKGEVEEGMCHALLCDQAGNGVYYEDDPDFYAEFAVPTNRLVWIRALLPGSADFAYSYKKTVMGVDITFTDTLHFEALPPALLPDYDRNGIWDETDLLAASRKERFNFWRNDDREELHLDTYGVSDWPTYLPPVDTPLDDARQFPDSFDAIVNGAKDWHDFFPLKLNLKDYLTLYPPGDYIYTLKSEGKLNLWTASLNPEISQLTAGHLNPGRDDLYIPTLRNVLSIPDYTTVQPLNNDFLIPYELLLAIRNNPKNEYALLFEGRAFSEHTSALKLVIEPNDPFPAVYEEEVPVRIVPVEHMFRYHNLLSQAGKIDTTISEAYYNTDYSAWGSRESGIDLFFVHGYNVDSTDSRGWACEMFKRFYWSGSSAQFHAVHWYGFDSQIPMPYPILKFTPDFHSNVFHAFKTAPELARRINARANSGKRVVLIGHSLGCMLSSAAVSLYSANVSDLVIANAAVALEAYYSDTEKPLSMIHEKWRDTENNNVFNSDTFASEWHTYFASGYPYHYLTIRDLFSNTNNARFHQFYSTSDEATGNIRLKLGNPIEDAKYAAWCVQELYKGRSWDDEPTEKGAMGGSKWMGWGFCDQAEQYGADWANNGSVNRLMSFPAFRHKPSELFTGPFPNSDREAFAENHRFEILARGIPARTFSAGANAVNNRSEFTSSFNMNNPMDGIMGRYWLRPEDPFWRHNDIREMPYASVRKFFDRIVELGELKGVDYEN